MSFAAEFPDTYAKLKREERDTRSVIGSDQCIIDQKLFFIRGCLEIPIVGSVEPFLWGLWVVLHEAVFDEIEDRWELQGREQTRGPYKGRLNNTLSIYPETFNLKVRIVIQPVGTRPLLFIEEEHPLAFEQLHGITVSRAQELASILLHS